MAFSFGHQSCQWSHVNFLSIHYVHLRGVKCYIRNSVLTLSPLKFDSTYFPIRYADCTGNLWFMSRVMQVEVDYETTMGAAMLFPVTSLDQMGAL